MQLSKQFIEEMFNDMGLKRDHTITAHSFQHDNANGDFIADNNVSYFGFLNNQSDEVKAIYRKQSPHVIELRNSSIRQTVVLFDKLQNAGGAAGYVVQFIGYKIVHNSYGRTEDVLAIQSPRK